MRTLLVGDGAFLHPVRAQWGRTDLIYGIVQDASEDQLCLSSHLF